MTTMDHTDATLTGAAERYILGEMDEQERERYEAHFFACAACADEVRAAARFADAARPLLAQDPRPARERAAAPPVPSGPTWWQGLLASFGPLPLGTAAAALLFACLAGYQMFVVVPSLRQEVREAGSVQSAPSYFLSIARGDPPVVALSGSERVVGLTLSRSLDRSFPFYRYDLQDSTGRTIESGTLRAAASGDELHVIVPVRQLPAGSYAIVVAGLESESSTTPASDSVRYPFTLTRRDSAR